MTNTGSILLSDYAKRVALTDKIASDDIQTILLGLFGEVGSIMATAKKLHREKEAYPGYRLAVEEEFGDALWYFAALCKRLHVPIEDAFAGALKKGSYATAIAATDFVDSPLSHIATPLVVRKLDPALFELGKKASALFGLIDSSSAAKPLLEDFADCYAHALSVAKVTFAAIVHKNISKTIGRFIAPDYASLPTFDDGFPDVERLPDHFEIEVDQRKSGRSYLRWNGVFVGDPLTDNIADRDGYRFHDVFHLAHAAILHWSPTFRALIKQKRKSCSKTDEEQDSGRAIVVEEGLTAWIFSQAKTVNFFEGQNRLSFDLLKGVSEFVRGYEVEACPLNLWETAILQGYDAFRQLKMHNGGIVVGDRKSRTIAYKALEEA